jgi:hypothetical protein
MKRFGKQGIFAFALFFVVSLSTFDWSWGQG